MAKYNQEKIKELKLKGYSWNKIAQELGYRSGEAVRWSARSQDWYKAMRNKSSLIEYNHADEFRSQQLLSDGSVSSITRKVLDEYKDTFTKKELLEIHKLDPEEFQIKQIVSNEWSVTNSKGERFYNFQSKIIAEPLKGAYELVAHLEELILKFSKPFIINSSKASEKTNESLIIPIADPHFGLNKASDYKAYQDKILARIGNQKTIVISMLGDILHTDNFVHTTVSGTRVNDTDIPMAWEEASKFFEPIIQKALQVTSDVRLIYSRGNHDESITWAYCRYLQVKYPQASVDVTTDQLKVTVVDKFAVYFSHGHKAQKRLPALCAGLYPKEWGETVNRILLTGHYHTMKLDDFAGIRHYQQPTVSKHTDYEKDNLFLGNKKGIHLYEITDSDISAIYYL